jgi:glycosyltransferase involved in cell wall biosynthesis
VYGRNEERRRDDERDIEWATPLRNRSFHVAGREFFWQSLPSSIRSADLVILMQETRILSNFGVLLRALLTRQRVAFWGHGINFQDQTGSFANSLKRIYSTRVHWWFAYTESVAELVAAMGFPRERITVVQNAIDTVGLSRASKSLSDQDIARTQKELGIGNGPVGIYCGGMYAEKRLDFLIEACRRIKSRIPQFEMLFLGSGPDQYLVERFAAEAPWVHYVGPRFEDQRVPYFRLADVFLMPGLVGLAVLDTFALTVPLVTTDFPFHSPEIAYLEDHRNGIICANDTDSFTNSVVEVLQSSALRNTLKDGCLESARRYTLQAMVGNFSAGVIQALE